MRQQEIDRQAAAKRNARYQRAQLKDITVLLDTPEFRRYAKRYLAICSVFKTTFTGSSETFFREGQRSIGTTMLGEIMQAGPQRFAEIMAERMPEDDDAEEGDTET